MRINNKNSSNSSTAMSGSRKDDASLFFDSTTTTTTGSTEEDGETTSATTTTTTTTTTHMARKEMNDSDQEQPQRPTILSSCNNNGTATTSTTTMPAAAAAATATTGARRTAGDKGGGDKMNHNHNNNNSNSGGGGCIRMDAAAYASWVQVASILADQGYVAVAHILKNYHPATTTTTTTTNNNNISSSSSSSSSSGNGGSTTSTSSSNGSGNHNTGHANGMMSSGGSGSGGGGVIHIAAVCNQLDSTIESVATKCAADHPPWMHFSKADMAPPLKTMSSGSSGGGGGSAAPWKTTLVGGFRGYRMARATSGVSTGEWYYEMLLLPGPTAQEIAQQLPPHARLGAKLEAAMQEQLQSEQQQQQQSIAPHTSTNDDTRSDESTKCDVPHSYPNKRARMATATTTSSSSSSAPPTSVPTSKSSSITTTTALTTLPTHQRIGGHVRAGWSLRSGDLHAPVGYDQWSYAIRDIGGSIIHKSIRNDTWQNDPTTCNNRHNNMMDGEEEEEGENDNDDSQQDHDNPDPQSRLRGVMNTTTALVRCNFETHDVMGCGICLTGEHPHIRFFHNGVCLGNFVIRKGKRMGGVAFPIEPGTYYPAISLYMGGSVRVNFGPHWIYPPRKLPTGFPKFTPMSRQVDKPRSPEEAVAACDAALKLLRQIESSSTGTTHHHHPKTQQSSSSSSNASSSSSSMMMNMMPPPPPLSLVRAVHAAIAAEARIQCEAHDKYTRAQLEFVQSERQRRGLSTTDVSNALIAAAAAAATIASVPAGGTVATGR